MRKLALDLGTKTCGIAISDESNIIATGLENFRFLEKNFTAVINKVKEYFEQYPIDKIILGYPLRVNGTKSERTVMVEEFKIRLEKELQIPVILVNEQYTTKNAENILIQAGFTRKKRKNFKDKLSAQLILEEYLTYYEN